jgi:hypothetical protein
MSKKVKDIVVWDGKQPHTYNYWCTKTFIDLCELDIVYVLAVSRVYQLQENGSIPTKYVDPNIALNKQVYPPAEYEKWVYEDLHKKTRDAYESDKEKAYGHVFNALSASIAQSLMNSEPNSAVAFIKTLDQLHLKQDTLSVVLYLEQYIKFHSGS